MTISSASSIRNLSEIIRGISEASGASIPKVIDHEMGKILEKCISLTPSATESKIVANALDREWGSHKLSYAPARPFKGKLSKTGKKRYRYSNRYPSALWDEMSKQRLESIQKRVGSAGISKQSWAQCAKMLGLEIKVPAKVKKIPVSFNQNFDVSRKGGDAGEYFIQIVNGQPTINKIGGKSIAKRAVAGRVSFFKKNIEKGALQTIESATKAYPGLRVSAESGGLE